MSETASRRVFLFSLGVIICGVFFFYGLVSAQFKIQPYLLIKDIYSLSLSIMRYGKIVPENRLINVGDKFPRERFSFYRKDRQMNGYYVFLGYDGKKDQYAAWLYDRNGNQQHIWELDYSEYDLDGPLNGSDFPHAFSVLADGSIIVSFDAGDVMTRINSCGEVMWRKSGVYHHALSLADDGSFWTWKGEGTAYGQYQFLEKFDPETGETLQSIGLVDDIVRQSLTQGSIFGIRPDFNFKHFAKDPPDKELVDIFHPNDIDVLTKNLADNFPDFKAGDLLLSFRTNHLVAVLDPNDAKIKWWSHGPWRYQHDPDFTSDGNISIYSNNTGLGRSEILKINPVTRSISNDLADGNLNFYSGYQGKHQYLPNKNVLIVIPDEGRVLEVTSNGNKVFEFNNISSISTQYNEHIANGLWLPINYFKTPITCALNS